MLQEPLVAHHVKERPIYLQFATISAHTAECPFLISSASAFPHRGLCHADFKNVSIVAHYIKERTRNAQFVIISLRNNMFELADRLVGIYKTDNATKSVTINPSAFVIQPTAVTAN